jgi:hypothetical protein
MVELRLDVSNYFLCEAVLQLIDERIQQAVSRAAIELLRAAQLVELPFFLGGLSALPGDISTGTHIDHPAIFVKEDLRLPLMPGACFSSFGANGRLELARLFSIEAVYGLSEFFTDAAIVLFDRLAHEGQLDVFIGLHNTKVLCGEHWVKDRRNIRYPFTQLIMSIGLEIIWEGLAVFKAKSESLPHGHATLLIPAAFDDCTSITRSPNDIISFAARFNSLAAFNIGSGNGFCLLVAK